MVQCETGGRLGEFQQIVGVEQAVGAAVGATVGAVVGACVATGATVGGSVTTTGAAVGVVAGPQAARIIDIAMTKPGNTNNRRLFIFLLLSRDK